MATDTTLAGLDALDLGDEPPVGGARDRLARIGNIVWPKVAAVALVWVIWELVHLSGWKHYVLPGPGVTLSNLWEQAKTGLLWHAIGDTMERAVIGYALALVIGTVVGLLVARVPLLRNAVGSLITGLQTMPSIAWFPLAILLFRLTNGAILFVVVLGAAPSIANGLISGIDNIPPLWLRAGKVLGARGTATLRHVVLPAALPAFVAGLKQGWAFAWRSLLAGELLVQIPGTFSLGQRLEFFRNFNDAPGVISVMIIILVIGILVDELLFGTVERAIRRRYGLVDDAAG
jgi:NitT/TauT family transport system permease protein